MTIMIPDFDTLKQMAEQDPTALERLRQEKTTALIESAPEAYQARLRGIQFQVDSQRLLAKNPIQSCMKISQLMHESFTDLKSKLQDLNQATSFLNSSSVNSLSYKDSTKTETATSSAKIIAFPSPDAIAS